MNKSWIVRLTLAAAFVVLVAAAPAAAQTFDAEIDCGGVFGPGSSVPFTVRLEEQGFITHQIDASVKLTAPVIGQITLASGSFTLNPNQDKVINRNVNLPLAAPSGSYQMSVTADDGTEIAFDTCSFNVN